MRFSTANNAFIFLCDKILREGVERDNTLTLFNQGFYIERPNLRLINVDFRKWNLSYAEFEWEWYKSKNPNAEEISRRAPIWKNHMDEDGNVNSNYGHQYNRNSMLDKVVDLLNEDPLSRRAVLSIYDGKEIDLYKNDTPCTNSIHFQIIDNKLCMTVNMRSNDLWFGFCNDQYCFSMLQEEIATQLGIEMGWYYHFASNLHLYNNHVNTIKNR